MNQGKKNNLSKADIDDIYKEIMSAKKGKKLILQIVKETHDEFFKFFIKTGKDLPEFNYENLKNKLGFKEIITLIHLKLI